MPSSCNCLIISTVFISCFIFILPTKQEQKKLIEPADDAVKALVAWGWQISYSSPNTRTQGAHHTGKPSIANMGNSTGSYCPSPVDLKNVTISRDMVVCIT